MNHRLRRIEKFTDNVGSWLAIRFTVSGTEAGMVLELPQDWDVWSRAQKVEWGKQQLVDHLKQYNYVQPGEVVYPDLEVSEQAAIDLENLPGWATWTAAEAAAWIDANVTDLASAKLVLEAMAKAIIYLRDVAIER